MGSHLMHLVIANEVLAHLTDVDRTAFLLGNLAPDATTSRKGRIRCFCHTSSMVTSRRASFVADRWFNRKVR